MHVSPFHRSPIENAIGQQELLLRHLSEQQDTTSLQRSEGHAELFDFTFVTRKRGQNRARYPRVLCGDHKNLT